MENKLFNKAQQNLQELWGYESFLEGQQEAIQSVIDGKPTLVLFPTGGGKSLCYQAPATVFEGMTLVISPLIALMQDQVEQLNRQNISATFINSTLPKWEVEQRLVNARNGMYKLFYCSPERLGSELWKAELPNLDISMVAVDEAHCISEWGHDFRPDYRNIHPALESIADSTRWIALTATATPEVRADIIENLHFEQPEVISTGFQRPNLKWWVVNSAKKNEKLIRSVKKASNTGSGLIYAGTRRNCKKLCDLINNTLNLKAASYHAGLSNAERTSIQEAWSSGKLSLVVATSAFGMGIDKADCRYVIHYQMPYSLEAYYQQAGRAGRDGLKSYPILLFKPSDQREALRRIKDSYPGKKQLQKVYDALCDSLNLAVGSVLQELQEISLDKIKKRSNLSYGIVHSCLNVLKNTNIIEYEDHFIPQVGVHFLVSPDYVRDQINKEDNEKKANFLDLLYRRLGREAFEDFKYLKLASVQQKLETSKNSVIKGLQVLQNNDYLLEFKVLGERPLVRPVEGRVKNIPISKKKLEQDRNRLIKKLDYMKGYIETDGCRELYIRRYFGENVTKPCGHCDNCLNQDGQRLLNKADIDKIKEVLSNESKTKQEIQKQLRWPKNKLKRVISHLLREEKIKPQNGNQFIWRE